MASSSSRISPFSTRNPFTSSDEEDVVVEDGGGGGGGGGQGRRTRPHSSSSLKAKSFNPFDSDSDDDVGGADGGLDDASVADPISVKMSGFSPHPSTKKEKRALRFSDVQKVGGVKYHSTDGSEAGVAVEKEGKEEGEGMQIHAQAHRRRGGERTRCRDFKKMDSNRIMGAGDFDGITSSSGDKNQRLTSSHSMGNNGFDHCPASRLKEHTSFEGNDGVSDANAMRTSNHSNCMQPPSHTIGLNYTHGSTIRLNSMHSSTIGSNSVCDSNDTRSSDSISSVKGSNGTFRCVNGESSPAGKRNQLLSGGTRNSDRTLTSRLRRCENNDNQIVDPLEMASIGVDESSGMRPIATRSPPHRLHFDGHDFSERKSSVQELEEYALRESEDTTKSLWSCIKIAEDVREEASRTAINLHQQGEKLIQSHEVAVQIDANLTVGEKLLGSLGGIFSRPWRPKRGFSLTGPLIPSTDQSFQSKTKHTNINVKENKGRQVQDFSCSERKTVQQKIETERAKQEDALSDLSNILDQIKEMSIDMGSEISRQNASLECFYNDANKLEDRVKDANSRGRRLLGK